MTKEQFTIDRRPGWTFLTSLAVTIECDPLASAAVKIGLAVKAAFEKKENLRGADLQGADLQGAYLRGADLQGADLQGADLRGADLQGAYLRGADLQGADLQGADLQGAYLRGAYLQGKKISRLVAAVERLTDPYTFYGFELEAGGLKISAGCRWFTIPEFRAHVAAEYPGTAKAEETLDILDFLERRAIRAGVITMDAPVAKKSRAKAAK